MARFFNSQPFCIFCSTELNSPTEIAFVNKYLIEKKHYTAVSSPSHSIGIVISEIQEHISLRKSRKQWWKQDCFSLVSVFLFTKNAGNYSVFGENDVTSALPEASGFIIANNETTLGTSHKGDDCWTHCVVIVSLGMGKHWELSLDLVLSSVTREMGFAMGSSRSLPSATCFRDSNSPITRRSVLWNHLSVAEDS